MLGRAGKIHRKDKHRKGEALNLGGKRKKFSTSSNQVLASWAVVIFYLASSPPSSMNIWLCKHGRNLMIYLFISLAVTGNTG